MSTSMRAGVRSSSSDRMNASGSSRVIERAVDQVHADDAQRLLLLEIFLDRASARE